MLAHQTRPKSLHKTILYLFLRTKTFKVLVLGNFINLFKSDDELTQGTFAKQMQAAPQSTQDFRSKN